MAAMLLASAEEVRKPKESPLKFKWTTKERLTERDICLRVTTWSLQKPKTQKCTSLTTSNTLHDHRQMKSNQIWSFLGIREKAMVFRGILRGKDTFCQAPTMDWSVFGIYLNLMSLQLQFSLFKSSLITRKSWKMLHGHIMILTFLVLSVTTRDSWCKKTFS